MLFRAALLVANSLGFYDTLRNSLNTLSRARARDGLEGSGPAVSGAGNPVCGRSRHASGGTAVAAADRAARARTRPGATQSTGSIIIPRLADLNDARNLTAAGGVFPRRSIRCSRDVRGYRMVRGDRARPELERRGYQQYRRRLAARRARAACTRFRGHRPRQRRAALAGAGRRFAV